MKIDRDRLEKKFARYLQPDEPSRWIHNNKIYNEQTGFENVLEFIVPDDDDNPDSESVEYLLRILENLEAVERQCVESIRWFIKLEGEFKLQSIEILDKNVDRHGAQAVLFFSWDRDVYLFTEVGLIELKSLYVLAKYH